jgi:tripartite-type tricarboxylate transporter receptor subunit TctC
LLVNTSTQAYSAALLKNLPYDLLKDFIPVAPLTSQPYVLVTGKLTGITTVGELAAAKAKPGQLRFGSTGMGTGSHLGIEKCNLAADIKAVHVPARPGDAIADRSPIRSQGVWITYWRPSSSPWSISVRAGCAH